MRAEIAECTPRYYLCAEIAVFVLNPSDILFVRKTPHTNMRAYIALTRVGGKQGILSEEKLGVLFQ